MDNDMKRIQHAIATAAVWESINPILFKGEIGFESDTHKFKIGDGMTAWKDLFYSPSCGVYFHSGKGIEVNDGTISATLLYEVI